MNRLIIILGITVVAILGSIYLLRRSSPATANSSSYSPLDPTVRATPEEIAALPKSTTPLGNSQKDLGSDLAQAFQLPEDEAWKTITGIVEEWGASDPSATFNALLRGPEGELRHNALIQLAAIWAERNPQLAADTFKTQTAGDENERGVAQAITTWAKTDPMAALNWVNQNSSDVESRNPLRERFYSAGSSVEPEDAAR